MIKTHYSGSDLEYKTQTLMQRMLNPICGLTQEIGFIKRSKFGSRILTTGAEITGVHNLLNKKDPGRGAYHTGGAGIRLNESIIKSLGETVERYSQLIAEISNQHQLIFSSHEEMQNNHENVLSRDYLDLYTQQQLANEHFPFQVFNEKLPLSWLKATSLISGAAHYIPAQLMLVGYQVKHDQNEPWYATAVTTGTAAHTHLTSALLGAILEIIQIDSTIGHWYTDYVIPEIVFDKRTIPIESLINKYGNPEHNPARFFWLKNSDLAGISIACLLEKPEKSIPRVSIGLGSSTSLNDAMYKAYLEAVGVSNLSNILILKEMLNQESHKHQHSDAIYDIDRNVALYGKGFNSSVIAKKFSANNKIVASDISADLVGSKEQQFKTLVNSFANSGKDLLFLDLTNTEAKELGFYVPRLWSKDTLSLCFPSAPPAKHPRFKNYGGFKHDIPHPYP